MAQFPRASLLLLTLFLTACGGEDSGSPASSTAPARQTDPAAPRPQPPIPAPRQDVQYAVRIVSINELDSVDHPAVIYVHEGDVIRLSADLFRNGRLTNRPSTEFSWRAGDGPVCDVVDEPSCEGSGFLVDNFGVDFIVPEGIGAELTISVGFSRNTDIFDKLVLRNLGPNFQYSDPRFHEFPRWNPKWDHQRHGRWEPGWDRRYRGNRPA